MRDTLLLVLAALKHFWHTVKLGLVQDEPVAMQCDADREERERRERSERVWCAVKASKAMPAPAPYRVLFKHPLRHVVYSYPSLDALHADVLREQDRLRAGQR